MSLSERLRELYCEHESDQDTGNEYCTECSVSWPCDYEEICREAEEAEEQAAETKRREQHAKSDVDEFIEWLYYLDYPDEFWMSLRSRVTVADIIGRAKGLRNVPSF